MITGIKRFPPEPWSRAKAKEKMIALTAQTSRQPVELDLLLTTSARCRLHALPLAGCLPSPLALPSLIRLPPARQPRRSYREFSAPRWLHSLVLVARIHPITRSEERRVGKEG